MGFSKFSFLSYSSYFCFFPMSSKLNIDSGRSCRKTVYRGLKCEMIDLIWKLSHKEEYASEKVPFYIKNQAFLTTPRLNS